MKFQPMFHIDNEEIIKILNGEIKLQVGQWIQLAWCNKPSRFVGVTRSGSIWAVHYPVTLDRFKTLATNYKFNK